VTFARDEQAHAHGRQRRPSPHSPATPKSPLCCSKRLFTTMHVSPSVSSTDNAHQWHLTGNQTSYSLFQNHDDRAIVETKGDMRQTREEQLAFSFPNGWGGARPNAGRKRSPRSNTPHRARPVHRAGEPVHVTLRARIAPLRSQFVFPSVRLAVMRAARRAPERFRIVHYSVQRDHLHLLVEACDARALSSGVRGLAIRIARYVNDLLGRRGPLWSDRWHGHALRTPREVRNALVYVLANFRKHSRHPLRAGIDPYSSARWFDGWLEWPPGSGVPPPFAEPITFIGTNSGTLDRAEAGVGGALESRTWLGTCGWKRRGLLRLDEAPRSKQRRKD
jgi:REP element-mobilizing transposase RayT